MAIASIGDFKRFLSLCLLHLEYPVFKEFSVREGRVEVPPPEEIEEGLGTFLSHTPVEDQLVSAL